MVESFLENNKDPDCKNIVNTMREKFKTLGCNMNTIVHFLHSHFDYFADNLGAGNEEQGGRFQQAIKYEGHCLQFSSKFDFLSG